MLVSSKIPTFNKRSVKVIEFGRLRTSESADIDMEFLKEKKKWWWPKEKKVWWETLGSN